jgi:hypothetical protein
LLDPGNYNSVRFTSSGDGWAVGLNFFFFRARFVAFARWILLREALRMEAQPIPDDFLDKQRPILGLPCLKFPFEADAALDWRKV